MDTIQTMALQAYKNSKSLSVAQEGKPPEDKLGQAIGDFASVLNNTENTARSAMMGNTDPHTLIAALAASQTAVDTVIAVRDRVVEAYQEIIRMQV